MQTDKCMHRLASQTARAHVRHARVHRYGMPSSMLCEQWACTHAKQQQQSAMSCNECEACKQQLVQHCLQVHSCTSTMLKTAFHNQHAICSSLKHTAFCQQQLQGLDAVAAANASLLLFATFASSCRHGAPIILSLLDAPSTQPGQTRCDAIEAASTTPHTLLSSSFKRLLVLLPLLWQTKSHTWHVRCCYKL